jgi:predicted HTH transcriptional regulator
VPKFGPRSPSVSQDRISAGANKRRERGLEKRHAAIAERRDVIVDELQQWGAQTALELAVAFLWSRDTIDEDLKALEAEGLVVREGKAGGKVIFRATNPRQER